MKELNMPQNPPTHPLPPRVSCGNHMWEGWEGEGFSRGALPSSFLSAMCLQLSWHESELGCLSLTAGVMNKAENIPHSYKHLFVWKARIAPDLSVGHPFLFILIFTLTPNSLHQSLLWKKGQIKGWNLGIAPDKTGLFGEVAHWTRPLSLAIKELYTGAKKAGFDHFLNRRSICA